MADVVVVGSVNMDLVVRAPRMPRPGETLYGHGFSTVPGGKGANQAAAAARLGARVEMVGRVGNDAFGQVLLDNLRAQGVGCDHLRRDPEAPSGVALIVVDDEGENSIVVAPGANGRVSTADLQGTRDLLAQARYLLLQLEIPLSTVAAAVRLAAELRLPVILNAAPAPTEPLDDALLAGLAYLVVNEHEAEALTGMEVPDLAAAEEAGRTLCARGPQATIITLGPQGALLVADGQALHAPAQQVRAVDTTGAGDAFVGGLAAALLRGLAAAEAVRYAACAGTLATTVLGAQSSLPSAEQVEAFHRGGAL